MEVILLERVSKLGHMGEVVKVKDGYARNFLLRQGKALRATDANKAKFERDRAALEARSTADLKAHLRKLDTLTEPLAAALLEKAMVPQTARDCG